MNCDHTGSAHWLYLSRPASRPLAPPPTHPIAANPPGCSFLPHLTHSYLLLIHQVGPIWIQYLWQFAQVFNLFLSRRFLVDLGYLKAGQVSNIRSSINELLELLQLHGGPEAISYFRRYLRVDPPVTNQAIQRQRQKEEEKPSHQPWKQFTLI